MDKDTFIRMLHKNPGWNSMVRKGGMGIVVRFGGVDFLVFRDNASHYLRAIHQSTTNPAAIKAFNTLMSNCRQELEKELGQWNMVRLTRDDNESDR